MVMIDIDMPENCEDCYFNIVGFCHFNNCHIEDVLIRPDWCPLKEVKDDDSEKTKMEEITMIDSIDRQVVLKYIERLNNSGTGKKKSLEYLRKYVEHLPPTERKGRWIIKDESYWRSHHSGDIQVNKAGLYCSECDKRLANAQKYRDFCPHCGARMQIEEF